MASRAGGVDPPVVQGLEAPEDQSAELGLGQGCQAPPKPAP